MLFSYFIFINNKPVFVSVTKCLYLGGPCDVKSVRCVRAYTARAMVCRIRLCTCALCTAAPYIIYLSIPYRYNQRVVSCLERYLTYTADSGSTRLTRKLLQKQTNTMDYWIGFGLVLISDFLIPPPCPNMLAQTISTFQH